MKVVFGLSVVNALATANADAKEINANTDRFGRLSIFFSSIVVLSPKLLICRLDWRWISPSRCGVCRFLLSGHDFSEYNRNIYFRSGLHRVKCPEFPDHMKTHQAPVEGTTVAHRARSELCEIYDILLRVTSKNCSNPLRKTVILIFSPTFLL